MEMELNLNTPCFSNWRTEVKASGNVFGNHFQVATYGESHGGGVGCVISGCPPRIPLTEADMQVELDRRCVSLTSH